MGGQEKALTAVVPKICIVTKSDFHLSRSFVVSRMTRTRCCCSSVDAPFACAEL